MPLFDDMDQQPNKELQTGGSGLLAGRCANFILSAQSSPDAVSYFGSIGKDDRGQILETDLSKEGIRTNMHKEDNVETSVCAILILNKERTMCCNLAAAQKYPTSHFEANLETF